MSSLAMTYGSAAVKMRRETDEAGEVAAGRRLTGYAASQGTAEGPCTVVSRPEDLIKIRKGTILVCKTAWPKLLPFIGWLNGLVTETGGSLSIPAGCAREHGIPAVVGVDGILEAVRDGDVLRVDGAKGTVEVIS